MNRTLLEMKLNVLLGGVEGAEKAIQILLDADWEKLQADTCPNFEVWLERLPTEPIDGLADKCWSWIKYWGSGGGDWSTECCIKEAITELQSDVPIALADTIFHSVCDYSKTPFDASCLTMQLVDECMDELRGEKQ